MERKIKMWTAEQCERLALEENLVRKYFSNFTAYNRTGNTYYSGWIKEAGYRTQYILRLDLPACFPDEKPSLYVEVPKILWKKDNGTINSTNTSHDWHIYGNGEDNCVKICFTSDWNSTCTCLLALQRGRVWVAAYETHLITGETIAQIIDRWKKKLGD
jgi:hypothetical protein